MRVALQPLFVLALGLVAAQDITGNSARGLEQVNDGNQIADRGLHGVDPNVLEVRAKKPTTKKTTPQTTPKKTTTSAAKPTTSSVVTTTSSQKTTSTSSTKSSSTISSTTSSIPSTTSQATSSSSSSAISSSSASSSSSSASSSGGSSSSLSSSSSSTGTITDSVTSLTASATTTGTATSTGTETSTSATSTTIYKPSRKWCDTSGSCSSTSCSVPVKQGSNSTSTALRRSHPAALAKRTFVDPVANWEGLAELDSSDISQYAHSEFMEFGNDASAIYIDGLIGCTAIGVFSKEGMQVYHLWESPAYNKGNGNLMRDPVDTLWPAKNQEFVRKTLAKAKTELAKNKAKFAGGELVIMLPKQGASYLYEVDKTYKWSDKTASGGVSKATWGRMVLNEELEVQGKGVVNLIKAMAKEATGISSIKECTYTPKEEDMTAGRFVVQYDPKGTGNKKAVQVWCESSKQYPASGYTW